MNADSLPIIMNQIVTDPVLFYVLLRRLWYFVAAVDIIEDCASKEQPLRCVCP